MTEPTIPPLPSSLPLPEPWDTTNVFSYNGVAAHLPAAMSAAMLITSQPAPDGAPPVPNATLAFVEMPRPKSAKTIDVAALLAMLPALPPPVDPATKSVCKSCKGTGEKECECCDGEGTISCNAVNCGRNHTCDTCDGTGTAACDCEEGEALKGPTVYACIRILGALFDSKFLRAVSIIAADGPAKAWRAGKSSDDALVIECGTSRLFVMPVRPATSDKSTVVDFPV